MNSFLRVGVQSRRRWAMSLLAVPLMGLAGTALAQSINLVVNHDAIPETATGLAGGDFSYAPLVSNNTPDGSPATNVTLTQVLPPGVLLNSITFEPPGSGACPGTPAMPFPVDSGNQTIACDLNDITQVGEQHGIRVLFNVTIPEVNTNWNAVASATATNVVSDGSNQNLPRNITTNVAADLGIELLGPIGPVTQFQAFDYTIKVTNHGPSDIPVDGASVVSFSVPAGTVAGTVNPTSGWVCTPNGGPAGTEMECRYDGPLARGETIPSDLIIPVTPTVSGEIDAAASVSGEGADGEPFPDAVLGNNTDHALLEIAPDNVVNVTVAKSASPTVIDADNAENKVAYTITPRRVSGADVPNEVRIRDELPAGILSYVWTQISGWNCDASTTTVIDCAFIGTDPGVGGNYDSITFQGTINGNSGGTVQNTVGVSASNEHLDATNDNTATAVVTISDEVDLTLSKGVSQSPIQQGQPFNWTLTVRNQGSIPVHAGQAITVQESVPVGIAINGFTGEGWSCTPATATGPATIICTKSDGLAAGASSTITLNSVGTFSGTNSYVGITNSASITGVIGRDPFEPITDSATVNVSNHEVDIGIVKSANPTTVVSGTGEVTYTLLVTNHSSTHPSTGIVVQDTLSNLVTSEHGCTFDVNGTCESGSAPWPNGGFVGAEITGGTGGSCSAGGGANSTSRTVTCNIDSLDAGASASIIIKALHRDPNTDGSNDGLMLDNTATVRSTEVEDRNDENNSSTVQVTVTPLADLQVFKVPTPTPAAVGEPVTYTVHVRNAGPSDAGGVTLRDELPANAHWIASGFQSGSATCNSIEDDAEGAVLECSWTSALAVNGQFAITYQLRSSPDADPEQDRLENTVEVKTTTDELDYYNNSDEAVVELKPSELDVVINMQHTADALVLGEETEYTITVTNMGPSYATQVKMTDLFPSTLDINGQEYPSSAIFRYDGITDLNSRVGSSGTPQDVMADVAALCEQPATDAETTAPLQLVCTFDKLAPGETMTIKFKMTATQLPGEQNTGTIFHNAKVELHETEYLSNGNDTDFNNITSDRTSARRTADTPLPEVADLGLTKDADSEVDKDSQTLKAGDPLVYTLTVTNYGPEESTGSLIRDTLPAGLDYVASPGCDFIEETRLLTCAVGSLAIDESKAFTIDTTVANPYTGGPIIENEAEVFAEGDPNPSNNKDRSRTKVFKPVEAVPTLSERGLIIMSALIALLMLGIRRRQMR